MGKHFLDDIDSLIFNSGWFESLISALRTKLSLENILCIGLYISSSQLDMSIHIHQEIVVSIHIGRILGKLVS